MNSTLKNALSFLGALLIGFALLWLTSSLSTYQPGGSIFNPMNFAIVGFAASYLMLSLGKPPRNALVVCSGWAMLGLSIGLMAPFVVKYLILPV